MHNEHAATAPSFTNRHKKINYYLLSLQRCIDFCHLQIMFLTRTVHAAEHDGSHLKKSWVFSIFL